MDTEGTDYIHRLISNYQQEYFLSFYTKDKLIQFLE